MAETLACLAGLAGMRRRRFFPALLFAFGEPELGKTATGLLGLTLVSIAYMSVGAFASSVTRNQLIAFLLGLVLLVVSVVRERIYKRNRTRYKNVIR